MHLIMLLAYDVHYCQYATTAMFRTKGSFSIDLENASTDPYHKENDRLKVIKGFSVINSCSDPFFAHHFVHNRTHPVG